VVTSDTGRVTRVVLGRFTGTDPDSGTSYDEDAISVTAADPEGSARATVTGTAEDLDAWLWHRRDGSALSITGDRDVIARLQSVLTQPID
jgi:hypothetical protein